MKNLFKINLAMMLALFLITSCKKTQDVKVQEEKAIAPAEMQNKANPYDEQGEMYNGFLNAMEADTTASEKEKFDASIYAGALNVDNGGWNVGQIAGEKGPNGWNVPHVFSLAMNFYESKGKASGDQAKKILSMQLESFSNLGTFSPIDDCLWRPDRCKHTKLALAALDPSNGGTAHDRTLKFISIIRDQEAEMQKNGELNEADKKALLILSSISRHAAGYWFNQTRDSDKPNDKILANMIQLSTIGASTAMMATDSEEVGVGTAILSAYIATGRAK